MLSSNHSIKICASHRCRRIPYLPHLRNYWESYACSNLGSPGSHSLATVVLGLVPGQRPTQISISPSSHLLLRCSQRPGPSHQWRHKSRCHSRVPFLPMVFRAFLIRRCVTPKEPQIRLCTPHRVLLQQKYKYNYNYKHMMDQSCNQSPPKSNIHRQATTDSISSYTSHTVSQIWHHALLRPTTTKQKLKMPQLQLESTSKKNPCAIRMQKCMQLGEDQQGF
jgi:hypothetical protein